MLTQILTSRGLVHWRPTHHSWLLLLLLLSIIIISPLTSANYLPPSQLLWSRNDSANRDLSVRGPLYITFHDSLQPAAAAAAARDITITTPLTAGRYERRALVVRQMAHTGRQGGPHTRGAHADSYVNKETRHRHQRLRLWMDPCHGRTTDRKLAVFYSF